MSKREVRMLNVKISDVPYQDRGIYGETITMQDLAQCEKITARVIIENNFDFTGQDVHLFRSTLKMTLKEFARKLEVTDVAVLRWEKGGTIPHAQKVLIKAFMRHNLELIPASYPVLSEFKQPELVELEYYTEDDMKRDHAA